MPAEQGVQLARRLIEQLVYKIGLSREKEGDSQAVGDWADAREEKTNRRKLHQRAQRERKG